MRQVVLDTETTGLETSQGHRIIEIGCVELIDRRITDHHWHFYVNPDREIDAGAFGVHGISSDFLQDKPRFADIAQDFLEYIKGAELIIHNAAFDVGFLDNELAKLDGENTSINSICSVRDTLALARQMHPGQKNNLDALCRRYFIDNSQRSLHGALLDARILADVYLAMTGGQTALSLDDDGGQEEDFGDVNFRAIERTGTLPIWTGTLESDQANAGYADFLATQCDDPAWK
jgi:DNA polymerase-3 subunit epsilon